ncbi:MAG: hypothetical protein LUG21_00875 [Clostridiales bacterium]|nr:hypothetical protein [Clostridiales bacterium]
MTLYIDAKESGFDSGVVFVSSSKNDFITCGSSVSDNVLKGGGDSDFKKSIKEKYKIEFFYKNNVPKINYYCVPVLDFFAFDENGFYATLNGKAIYEDAPVRYVDKKTLAVYDTAESFTDFMSSLRRGDFSKSTDNPDKKITVYESRAEAEKHITVYGVNPKMKIFLGSFRG